LSIGAPSVARRNSSLHAAVGLLVLSVAGSARADDGVSPSPAPPSTEERASAAYDKAMDLYGKGDKESALRFMSEAYALSPHVELVYDMAKLENELGRCRDALQHYQQYVRDARDGVTVDDAARAARTLQARCGEDLPKARMDTMRVIGWSAIGAGVVAGVSAVYFAIAGQAAAEDVQQILRADEQLGKSWNSGYQREQDGQRDNVIATVCAATAGTLIAGGTLVLVFASHPKSRREQSFSFGPVRGGSILTYTTHF
jgi:hypothetical protein